MAPAIAIPARGIARRLRLPAPRRFLRVLRPRIRLTGMAARPAAPKAEEAVAEAEQRLAAATCSGVRARICACRMRRPV